MSSCFKVNRLWQPSEIKLPNWYKPIDPTLQEFLKQYHASSETGGISGKNGNKKRRKNRCASSRFLRFVTRMIPFYDIPYQIDLGSCTLLKRTRGSKMKYSSRNNVIFVNFSRYYLRISVKTIATNINGVGLSVFGNGVELDVSKTDPETQTYTIPPILYKHDYIKNVRDDSRVLRHFSRNSINSTTNLQYLVLPKCLAASTVQLDPYSSAYYLTVEIVDENDNVKRVLMRDILHHTCWDLIFDDENINKDFNKMIHENLQDILETMTLEDQKRSSQLDKIRDAIKEQNELNRGSSRVPKTRVSGVLGALAVLLLTKGNVTN